MSRLRITEDLRRELHGKLATILEIGPLEYFDFVADIRTEYRYALIRKARERVLESVGRRKAGEAKQYAVPGGAILRVTDFEVNGPIAVQALQRKSDTLLWVDRDN